MARAPRIEFAGAFYHVMNRGNQLAPMVHDDRDRRTWLETLGESCRGAGWRAPSFVLMRSSIHLAGRRLLTDRGLAAKWRQLEKYDID